jgi:DnaJ-class molecular chaperone
MAQWVRPKAPVTILDDFHQPSIDEVLDHIRQNFFGYQPKGSFPRRRLGVEAVLDTDEARFGCRIPFRVNCYVRCWRCAGSGEPRWGLCPDCYGQGGAESSRDLILEIPSDSRHGQRYEVALGDAGIDNVLLDLRINVS